tara:strand:+ start:257 stop:430 length:174 start_codon:yes stop_codon:yes gene_type:complete
MMQKIINILEEILNRLFTLEQRQFKLSHKLDKILTKQNDDMFLQKQEYEEDCGKVEP